MPERKLPVVYVVVSGDGFPMDFARSRDHAEEFSKTRTNFDPLVVEYIPRAQANGVVACGECRFQIVCSGTLDCGHCCGLKRIKQDGSSSCSYAERKARGE